MNSMPEWLTDSMSKSLTDCFSVQYEGLTTECFVVMTDWLVHWLIHFFSLNHYITNSVNDWFNDSLTVKAYRFADLFCSAPSLMMPECTLVVPLPCRLWGGSSYLRGGAEHLPATHNGGQHQHSGWARSRTAATPKWECAAPQVSSIMDCKLLLQISDVKFLNTNLCVFCRRLRILNQQLQERERAERQARPVDCNLECKNIFWSFTSDFVEMDTKQRQNHLKYLDYYKIVI